MVQWNKPMDTEELTSFGGIARNKAMVFWDVKKTLWENLKQWGMAQVSNAIFPIFLWQTWPKWVVPYRSRTSQVHFPLLFSANFHGSLNVPIEHHPTIRYMVYNGYHKVMSNIPKMGHSPTPDFVGYSCKCSQLHPAHPGNGCLSSTCINTISELASIANRLVYCSWLITTMVITTMVIP